MKGDWQTSAMKDLFQVISKLKNASEAAAFMRDVATIDEITIMSKRWQAARMLQKKMPYRSIAETTGLSTTTVSRVAHWLHHGEGGYKRVLEKTRK